MSECVICQQQMKGEIAALMCGHLFHEKCIKDWFRQKQLCPCCKQSPAQAASRRCDKRLVKIFLDLGKSEHGTPVKQLLADCDENDLGAKIAVLTSDSLGLRREKQILELSIEEERRRVVALETKAAELQVQVVDGKKSLEEAALTVVEEQRQRTKLWAETQRCQHELSRCHRELQVAHDTIASKDKELSTFKVKVAFDQCLEHLEQGGDLNDFEELKSHSSEERCVELTRIMQWREKQHKKTQANEREMQKELQTLRTKGRLARGREEDLQKQVAELKRKCSRAKRELQNARAERGHVAGRSWEGDITEGNGMEGVGGEEGSDRVGCIGTESVQPEECGAEAGRFAGCQAAQAETDLDLQLALELDEEMNGRGAAAVQDSGGAEGRGGQGDGEKTNLKEASPGAAQVPQAKAASGQPQRGPVMYNQRALAGQSRPGSLIGSHRKLPGPGGSLNPSNDPDNPDRGGRFIRTGPDGMGGAINVFMKPVDSGSQLLGKGVPGRVGSLLNAKRPASGSCRAGSASGTGCKLAKKAKTGPGAGSITAFFRSA